MEADAELNLGELVLWCGVVSRSWTNPQLDSANTGSAANRARVLLRSTMRSSAAAIRRITFPPLETIRPAMLNNEKRSRLGRALLNWEGSATDFRALNTL
jgi:hypothetical protein